MKSITLIAIATCFTLTACSTLSPERTAAENLMGKNISEAFKQFGRPVMVGISPVKPGDKLYGQKTYLFEKLGASYNKDRIVASENGWYNGQPAHTDYIQTYRVQEGCKIMFMAGSDNIIDYYEVQGNCGLMGAGFGNTGALHRIGIN